MIKHPVFSCLEALEPRLAPAGIVALTVKGGVLTITGSDADEGNNIEINDAGNGQWRIFDGGGDGTTFSLNGSDDLAEVFVSVSGGVKVALTGGNDTLTFDNVQVGGPITLKDTGGNDAVNFSNTVVNGAIKMDTGSGDDNILATNSILNGALSIKTGTGDDSVTLGSGTYRSITTDLGTGENSFSISDPFANDPIQVFGNISVVNKGDADAEGSVDFFANDLLVTGSVKIKMGLGDSELSLASLNAAGSLVITGGLAYTGGSGLDEVNLAENVTIGGKADFKMGKGDSTVTTTDLEVLTLGSLSYTGGSGENVVNLNGASVSIGGDALFNMGAGSDNEVNFDSSESAFIAGKLTYKGGKGDDILSSEADDFQALGVLSFTAGAGFYGSLSINSITGSIGSVVYKGGTGLDAVQLGDFEDATESLTILGKVNVNLGKTASNEFFIHDTTFHGAVTIAGNTNQPGYQSIGIGDSTFLSSLTVKLSGTQGATVGLSNSTFLGAVSVTTGTGNDVVSLDTELGYGNALAKNIFEGPVKIILGTGDDTLSAGIALPSANDGNIFNGTVLFDGGAGLDFNNTASIRGNTYDGELTEKNFEPQLV